MAALYLELAYNFSFCSQVEAKNLLSKSAYLELLARQGAHNSRFQTSFPLQYEYGQQQLSSQALSLVRVVLNTLDSHFHRCRKVDDPALCGASSAYSRGGSESDKMCVINEIVVFHYF